MLLLLLLLLLVVVSASCSGTAPSTSSQAVSSRGMNSNNNSLFELGSWFPNYGPAGLDDFIYSASAAQAALETFAKRARGTAVFLDVWHGGRPAFPSPTWEKVMGEGWNASCNGGGPSPAECADVLQTAVPPALSAGLKPVAWFEYGLAYGGALQAKYPHWSIGEYNGLSFMDPRLPGVKALLRGLVGDALAYQPRLAGVQLDDHFCWPEGLPAGSNVSAAEKRAVLRELLVSVRQEVDRASLLRRRARPDSSRFALQLAPAPVQSAIPVFNVDWPAWLHSGLVDSVVVQLYTFSYLSFRLSLHEQASAMDKLGSRDWMSRFGVGILLNNGAQVNNEAGEMMRYALTATHWWGGAPLCGAGQSLWYARGVIRDNTTLVGSIWGNAVRL